MARIPEPQAGMVVRYEYLWARQHEEGMSYGEKTRPCAILAVINDKDDTTVYVSPITHTAPFHPEESILLTQDTKRRLGLDTQNSWLMVNEVNKFTWPGDDLRRIPHVQPASYTYGMLPETVLKEARSKLRDFNQKRQMHLVPRDAAAQHRTFNRAAG